MATKSVLIGAAVAATTLITAVAPASAQTPLQRAQLTASTRAATLTSAIERSRPGASQELTAATIRASSGVYVSVPSSVTTYNKKRVRVRPKVSVGHGVTKQVTGVRISVYSGKRRIATGSSARLRIGHYTERVFVRYHSWRYVSRYRTVTTKTWHDGYEPAGTKCVVDTVSSSEGNSTNDTIDTASCTNSGYPGQTRNITGSDLTDVPQGDGMENYTVGETVDTSMVSYNGYYTTSTKKIAYKVKQYTGYHSAATGKRRLTIRDGGYVKFFSGGDTDGGSVHFTTSTSSTWGYDIYCGDYGYFGINWSTSSGNGQFGPGSADEGETIQFARASFHGRVKMDIFATECTWTIGIFSKRPVR